MRNKIVLQRITVDGSLVKYEYSVSEKLKRFFTTESMFLRYDRAMTEVPLSILSIPFVNCMAGLSWLTGAMLFVDEIDETFYQAFKRLKAAYSELHEVNLKGMLVPSIIKKNEIQVRNHYLLLFGGGVDCHSSYLRNRDRVSGVINIYGWASTEDVVSNVDLSDKKITRAFADRFGINAFHVTSNFASQFNMSEIDKAFGTSYWYCYVHSMAFLAIATPIAWIDGYSNLMIASSFTKDRADVHCGSFITTDSEFKFAVNGQTLHDGFELNRQDKVRNLVDYQKVTGEPYSIQACSFNDHNCCVCEKCFRTIVELIAEGADPKDFGFNYHDSNTEHWKAVINRDVALWGVAKESYYYYYSRKRMLENYENIEDKEFVDWFVSFDFYKAKRQGLIRYYRQNFFSILKRKLKIK